MSIIRSLNNALQQKKEKNWEYIYILIDIHDTIFKSCYHNKETFEWYPYAKEALQIMSHRRDFKLIIWSSTYINDLEYYDNFLSDNFINIDYYNKNPECENTDLSDFSEKLYFNVGIDDKFGFDPYKDWYKLYKFLDTDN